MKTALFIIPFFIFSSLSSQTLTEYLSFTDHFDIHRYLKQYDRKFDSAGILTQKQEYHALTISFFGIMAYDNYNRTKKKEYYDYVINQYKYFQDSSHIHLFNNDQEIGLPYHFNFHDLKAPWYSGMTQGAAISYVLRYYDLTRDKSALRTAQSLTKFLIKDQKDGGTMGRTPEGFLFIEEYPNSASNPQVLNGFINGLIGLHEYLEYFPDDTLVRRIHDESYESMFKTLEHYDSPLWTTYNRHNKTISNQYIRYQITEFEHLYTIYKDIRLIDQMMIWSMMAYNKFDKTLTFYKYPQFQFSIPFQDSVLDRKHYFSIEAKVNSEKISLHPSDSIIPVSKKTEINLYNNTPLDSILISLSDGVVINKVSVPGLKKKEYEFIQTRNKNEATVRFITRKNNSNRIILSVKSHHGAEVKDLIGFYTSKYSKPHFAFAKSDSFIFAVEKESEYTLELNSTNIPNPTFFYRTGIDKGDLNNAKWIHYNKISIDRAFVAPISGYVEFMVCCELDSEKMFFDNLQLK